MQTKSGKQMRNLMKCWMVTVLLAVCGGADVSGGTPNFLFILADDWGWGDLSCHGHPYIRTPNIDRLAEEGTDFHHFTVASGVCSPSRTAFMTGHFPARYNINGHFAWVSSNARRGMPDWLDTGAPLLSGVLRKAGYRTAHYGKWHLANDMIPDSPTPDAYGFDDYGAFNCAGEQMPWFMDAARASDFISQSVGMNMPFYVNVWIHEPHTPFHTIPKYEWRFRELDRPDQIYASVLSHADDRIGQILKTLDDLGIAENTIVIFSSDNGPARSTNPVEPELYYDTATGAGWGIGASMGTTGGRRGYKSSLFEGGIGVPFIVRWPGQVAAGYVDTQSLISAVDLFPTVCELAGAEFPPGYQPDGVSIVDVLKGRPMPIRIRPLFWMMDAPWPPQSARPDHWVAWAIVEDQWKLVANKNLTHHRLFRIPEDITESNDLAGTNSDIANRLLGKISIWKNSLPEKPQGNVFSSLRNKINP